MNRRETIPALLALGVAPCIVDAQPAPARIALIGDGAAQSGTTGIAALRDSLRANGLIEGKDYLFDLFSADGKYERFPALLEEALARKPSVILVNTIAAVRAAQQATKTVPIVMTGTNDPVGSGLVASLARPGGNTTGLASMNEDLAGKLAELTREALPMAKQLAVLINPLNPSSRPIFQTLRKAAISIGMSAEAFEADAPERIDAAIAASSKMRPDALVAGFDAMLFDQRARIIAVGIAHKIPVISPHPGVGDAGALIAYGASASAAVGRIAVYVKKILAGNKPADLPVEQPTIFELVINLKTAKALGITIPRPFMLRADRVIE